MLNSLELYNFKSAKELSLKLGYLTVLTGLNGSGKSTVLQAVTLLKQSLNNESLNYSLSLQGPIINLGRSEDIRFENSETDNVTFAVNTPNGRIVLNIPTVEGSDTLPLSYEGDIKDLIAQFADGFQLIQADRITPASHYNQASSFERASGWLGCRGEFTIDYLIQRGENKVSQKRHFSDECGLISHEFLKQIAPTESLLDQTTGWLQQISPGARPRPISLDLADATALRFSYAGSSIDSNSRDHKAINVGFGLTYCLPIIVACLSAPAGSLLLIENPEAHLHPRGQAALGLLLSRCASDGVQIIVETHSDHVINGIRIAAKNKEINSEDVTVHFFSRNIETGETSNTSPILYDNGRFSEWPDGFFDEWSKALDELLD